jgi:hypothetical protein
MAVVAAMIGALSAGCGTSSKAVVPHPASSSTPTVSQDPARTAVLASYAGMWSDYEKDASTANWQNPTVVSHSTGKALLLLDENLAVDSHHGWIGKGHAVLHPEIDTLTPASNPVTASVSDCADLGNFLVYVATTGALKDNVPGGRHLVQASLVKKDGLWKVSELATGPTGSC